MKGILLKDLYIAQSGIVVTLTSLFVLAFGLSFLLDASSIFYCCRLHEHHQRRKFKME